MLYIVFLYTCDAQPRVLAHTAGRGGGAAARGRGAEGARGGARVLWAGGRAGRWAGGRVGGRAAAWCAHVRVCACACSAACDNTPLPTRSAPPPHLRHLARRRLVHPPAAALRLAHTCHRALGGAPLWVAPLGRRLLPRGPARVLAPPPRAALVGRVAARLGRGGRSPWCVRMRRGTPVQCAQLLPARARGLVLLGGLLHCAPRLPGARPWVCAV